MQDFASNAATYLLLSIKNWAGEHVECGYGFHFMVYFILEGNRAYAWFLSLFCLRTGTGWTAPCKGQR